MKKSRDRRDDGQERTARIIFLILLVVFPALPLHSVHALEIPEKIPVTIKADNLDYDRTSDVYTAVGHVKIEQAGKVLEAEKGKP